VFDKSQVFLEKVFKTEPKIGEPIQVYDKDLEELKSKFASLMSENDPMDDPYMMKRPLSLNISKPAAITITSAAVPKREVEISDSDDDSSVGSQKETKRIRSEVKIETIKLA
jgi:hypothetical protein